jgi:hypothetical protein
VKPNFLSFKKRIKPVEAKVSTINKVCRIIAWLVEQSQVQRFESSYQ